MGERGPEPKKINWVEFEKLVAIQATQEEIADFFDISVDTLDRACQRDLGRKLAEVWDKKKNLGRVKLKKIQFDLAEQGSAIMAIFLGKHLLGQKADGPDDLDQVMSATGLTNEDVIALIRKNQAEASIVSKKSFVEFCRDADFPEPFQKQIEMVNFGINETDPRLLLGARGYGKTDYVTIAGVAYDIYMNPLESTTMIMSKSTERNAAMLAEIQLACEKNGVRFEIANSKSLRAFGLLGKDHSVSAVTIGTKSLRGRHPKRAILEDAVTEDDTSEATRALVKKKYYEIMKLTQNVLVIGQPAHAFDLYADLRGLLKKLEVPHGSIPELDHDLEAMRAAGVDEKSIQASYFLKIISDGTTPFQDIKYLDRFPTGETAVAWIDPSFEGGDFTSLTILKQHLDGIAIVGFLYKQAWNHCLDKMLPHLGKFNVKRLGFEANSLGDQPVIMLRDLLKGTGIGVVGRKSTSNKHAKIMNAGAYAHLLHLSRESDPKYIQQVIQYEESAKNDDAPDGIASCLEWIGLIKGN
jgi:hypothetical protein